MGKAESHYVAALRPAEEREPAAMKQLKMDAILTPRSRAGSKPKAPPRAAPKTAKSAEPRGASSAARKARAKTNGHTAPAQFNGHAKPPEQEPRTRVGFGDPPHGAPRPKAKAKAKSAAAKKAAKPGLNGHAASLHLSTYEHFQQDQSAPPRFTEPPQNKPRPRTRANQALIPQVMPEGALSAEALTSRAYYADGNALVLHMEVTEALELLASQGIRVNCIVTSPPFYGQRDYEVENQIGLEAHPSAFIAKLADAFIKCRPVLADNGSMWVNIGDTYWSGKGEHKSGEAKQNARRFGLRPQDRKGDGKWCVPKQLLLIPHRLAIALQDQGWIVRNDNVWVKLNPIPDQVRDRCSLSHEYVFHFVKERWYYFDKEAVGRAGDKGSVLPPLDTWQVPPVRGSGGHKARFSEDLVRIPILSTTPQAGIVLDPFAGSGTSLIFARKRGFRAIGIDIKKDFCELMAQRLRDETV